MKNKKTNVGILGLGNMGRHHARIYHELPSANLLGIYDPNQEKCQELAAQYNCKSYISTDELLKNNHIEAINIITPTNTHHEIALKTLKANKHTFIEKPISDCTKKATTIMTLAKEKKLKLMIGHIERFNPAIIKLKQLINQKKLGSIISIHTKRIGPFPSQIKDANIMIDLAIHDIDIVCDLMNKTPSKITATTHNALIKDREDYAEIMLSFDHQTAIIQSNWISPKQERTLSILGTKGLIDLNYKTQEITFYETKLENHTKTNPKFIETTPQKIPVESKEPLFLELSHFIDGIQNKSQIIPTGEVGLNALKICETILNQK